jgi:hypothetical protein
LELTSTVPTLVCAVLIDAELELEAGLELELEPAAAGDAGVVLELLGAVLPHAASPTTAAARTGAAHHRLRIVSSPFATGDPRTPYTHGTRSDA